MRLEGGKEGSVQGGEREGKKMCKEGAQGATRSHWRRARGGVQTSHP